MAKVRQSRVEMQVDVETGAILSAVSNQTIDYGSEPSYIKLYFQDILYLSDLPKSHESLLFELLKRSTYADAEEGMTVTLSAGTKRRIAEKLDIKNIRSINNALSDMVKGEILFRVDTGCYRFNPYFFGRGEWQDIARLRLEISYDNINGRTFKTCCEYKDQYKTQQEQEAERAQARLAKLKNSEAADLKAPIA